LAKCAELRGNLGSGLEALGWDLSVCETTN